jgi:hypothetical protein
MVQTAQRFTYRGNNKATRYGWLRLTPAYSVHMVQDMLRSYSGNATRPLRQVLDPFCGTGTTALACAERGIPCTTTDINPFLIWLTRAKTYPYTAADLAQCRAMGNEIRQRLLHPPANAPMWRPPIYQIDKWWDEALCDGLAQIKASLDAWGTIISDAACNLLKVAFCRVLIETAHVSFGHQSMSFQKNHTNIPQLFSEHDLLATCWHQALHDVLASAESPVALPPHVSIGDARNLTSCVEHGTISHVITSPPYPNRMSYIRELRPYMYWLGFLADGRAAGELDWQAIGGTWGCATSNLTHWRSSKEAQTCLAELAEILARIGIHSPLLARYVQKYFEDMEQHCRSLFPLVESGGCITYIIGNSKFYDVVVPTERLFGALFAACGFTQILIEPLRKRSSKKELVEYAVIAQKP